MSVGPLQAIRHTLSLSGTMAYSPQLGSKQDASKNFNFSVGNRFDIKYLGEADSDSTRAIKKLDGLLDWGLGSTYNPDREREWTNISSTITFKPGASRNLSFKLNNTLDPYTWKVLDSRFAYGFGFSGRFDTGHDGQARDEEASDAVNRLGPAVPDSLAQALADSITAAAESPAAFDRPGDDPYGGNRDLLDGGAPGRQDRDDTDGGRFIPWQLGGSFSLNYATPNDNNADGVLTTRANINVTTQITRDWAFRYSASFDLNDGTISNQDYRLSRDLHCWRLEFTRTINSNNSEFGFRFYLKAIPELKLTRGREDLLGSAQSLNSLF